jgi:hypothetical protein
LAVPRQSFSKRRSRIGQAWRLRRQGLGVGWIGLARRKERQMSHIDAKKTAAGKTDAARADTGKADAARTGDGKANTPRDDTDAASRSGQFGSDKPGSDKDSAPKRGADKKPHPGGPEYEEGGQYPGTRKPGARG